MRYKFKSILFIFLFLSLIACPPKPKLEYVDIIVCIESGLIQNPYCPTVETRRFEKGKQPTEICQVHKAVEYIEIEVCKTSGFLPNKWCSEKEIRKYKKGEEPTAICAEHIEPQPSLPFIGTSVYQLMVFPDTDWKWFIDELKIAGGNATEIFLNFTWPAEEITAGWKIQPFKILRLDWTDDAFPGKLFPLFDLDQQDEIIWARLRSLFDYCFQKRIALFIRIQDFCSLKDSFEKRFYGFRSNKQRLIDSIFTGGIWGEPAKRWYSIQNTKLLSELNASGIIYFLAAMNEADYLSDPGDTEEKKNQIVMDFHKWYFEDLKSKGMPSDRFIISHSRAMDKMKPWGYILEIHSVNSDVALNRVISQWGTDKIFPNGDGPDPDAAGRPGDKSNKREPSIDQAKIIRQIILDKNLFGYCYFNRNVENGGIDLKKAKFDVLQYLSGALK